MVLKPLGIVREIIEAAGMGVSYAYDDLVFIDHNALLLEFSGKGSELLIHVNAEAVQSELEHDIVRLQNEASAREMTFYRGSFYRISQEDEDNIRLEFIDPE